MKKITLILGLLLYVSLTFAQNKHNVSYFYDISAEQILDKLDAGSPFEYKFKQNKYQYSVVTDGVWMLQVIYTQKELDSYAPNALLEYMLYRNDVFVEANNIEIENDASLTSAKTFEKANLIPYPKDDEFFISITDFELQDVDPAEVIVRVEFRAKALLYFDEGLLNSNKTIEVTEPILPGENKYIFDWDYVLGAEKYEISIWFNETELSEDNSNRPLIFETSDNHYEIESLYPRGELNFKLRAINSEKSGSQEATYSDFFNTTKVFTETISDQHNWIASKTFAEDGKSKSSISYYDDFYRPMQSIVGINTERNVLVSENYYDAEGRQALAVIPSVDVFSAENKKQFRYRDGYNKDADGNQLNYLDFDGVNPGALDNQSGSSGYFSSLNQSNGIYNDYIPDAEGIPYIKTNYSRDFYSRNVETSGLGTEFAMDGNHTTKLYYPTASSTEIHRLFRNGIGNGRNFTKVISKDPNGQHSVSYLNSGNQVVATALSFSAAPGVIALNSLQNIDEIEKSLPVGVKENDGCISSVTTITNLIADEGITINYSFTEEINELSCSDLTFCYTCSYRVSFSLIDPCGEPVTLNSTGGTYDGEVDALVFEVLGNPVSDGACPTEDQDVNNFMIEIDPLEFVGDYHLMKSICSYNPYEEEVRNIAALCINQDSILNYYLDQVDTTLCCATANNICYKQLIEENPELLQDETALEVAMLSCINQYIEDNGIAEITKEEYENNIRLRLELSYDPNNCDDYDVIEVAGPAFYSASFTVFDSEGVLWLFDGTKLINQQNGDITSGLILGGKDGEELGWDFSSQESRRNLFNSKNYYQNQWGKELLDQLIHLEYCRLEEIEIKADLFNFANSLSMMTIEYAQAYFLIDELDDMISEETLNIIIAADPLSSQSQCNFNISDVNERILLVENVTELCEAQNIECSFFNIVNSFDLSPEEKWTMMIGFYNKVREEVINDCFDCPSLESCSSFPPPLPNIEDIIIDETESVNEIAEESCEDKRTSMLQTYMSHFHPDEYAMPGSEDYLTTLEALRQNQELSSLLDDLCNEMCMPTYSSSNGYGQVLQELTNCSIFEQDIYSQPTPEERYHLRTTVELFPPLGDNNDYLNNCDFITDEVTHLNVLRIPRDLPQFKTEKNNFVPPISRIELHLNNAIVEDCSPLTDWKVNRLNVSVYLTKTDCKELEPVLIACNYMEGLHNNIILEFPRYPGYYYHDQLLIVTKRVVDATSGIKDPCGPVRVGIEYYADYKQQNSKNDFLDEEVTEANHQNLLSLSNLYNFVSENQDLAGIDKISYIKDIWNCNTVCYEGDACFEEIVTGLTIPKSFYESNTNFIESLSDEPLANCYSDISFKHVVEETPQPPDPNGEGGPQEFYYSKFSRLLVELNGDDRICEENSIEIEMRDEDGHFYKPAFDFATILDVAPFLLPYEFVDQYFTPEEDYFTGYTALIGEYENNEITQERQFRRFIRVYFIITEKSGKCKDLVQECIIEPDYEDYYEECLEEQISHYTEQAYHVIDQEISKRYDQLINEIDCNQNLNEIYSYSSLDAEYHYTLYYYDRAGNLIATLPPEAVVPLGSEYFIDGVLDESQSFPEHDTRFLTSYKYDHQNKMVSSSSPDKGFISYAYDKMQRLRFTQNEDQIEPGEKDGAVNYIKYDPHGRIVESGETSSSEWDLNDQSTPTSYLDRNVIIYDEAISDSPIEQTNLRNNVSFTFRENTNGRGVKEYYSYDSHDNVYEKANDFKFIDPKIMQYDYDLISGNVKTFSYQIDEKDQFLHKYKYDLDNRLTQVFTSSDQYYWEEDARYFYYAHGPLARMEVANDKVQGCDYRYNLQGWIKGVNAIGDVQGSFAPGKDGYTGEASSDVNRFFARDEMAYNLQFFEDDYKPISTNVILPIEANFYGNISQHLPTQVGLYNGNIVGMITDLRDLSSPIEAMSYKYDQLHRILESNSYSLSGSFTRNYLTDTEYSYDANGNLNELFRSHNGSEIDELDYTYDAVKPNRLLKVEDGVSNTLDFDFEGTQEYEYNKRGNLISRDNLVDIYWNFDDKIRDVHPTGDAALEYSYDAAGDRVISSKLQQNAKIVHTIYSRDASNNVIAIYNVTQEQDPLVKPQLTKYEREENYIYGSSRVGVNKKEVNLITPVENELKLERNRAYTSYELSNHLGNVLTVVSDFKVKNIDSENLVFHDVPVLDVNDYYPFGMEKQSRGGSLGNRFGFNGKELDRHQLQNGENELVYDYGFRIYNPSIARFLSVDPLTSSYPWYTPYQFAGNKPIEFIDLDGLEEAKPSPSKSSRDVQVQDSRGVEIQIPDIKDFIFDFRPQPGGKFNAKTHKPLSLERRLDIVAGYRDLDRLQKVLDRLGNGEALPADDSNYYNEYLRTGETPFEFLQDMLGDEMFEKLTGTEIHKNSKSYYGQHVIYGIYSGGELIKVGLTSNMDVAKNHDYLNGHVERAVRQVNLMEAEDRGNGINTVYNIRVLERLEGYRYEALARELQIMIEKATEAGGEVMRGNLKEPRLKGKIDDKGKLTST